MKNMTVTHNRPSISRTPISFGRLLLGVAMAAVVISSAHAENVAPRSEITITGANVTLGDIFENVSHDASYALAPAPAAGAPLVLNASDLQRVSDAFALGWKASPIDKTIVRVAATDIDSYEADAALQTALKAALPQGRYEMQPSDRSLVMHVPKDQPATVDVINFRADAAHGSYTATLVAPSAANPLTRKDVAGRFYGVTSVPVVKTAMRDGDIISENDVIYADMRADQVAAGTLLEAAQLVGYTPRRVLAANSPVLASDLDMPTLVKKGETVTMTLSSGVLSLTLQGKALQNGAAGEIVRVLNTTSNQVVEGRVTAQNTIAVSSPSAQLAQN